MSRRFYSLLIPLFVAGGLVGAITWNSLTHGTKVLGQAKRLNDLALLSQLYVNQMSDALKGYLLNPSDQSQFERKKAADGKNAKVIEEMKTLSGEPAILQVLEEMGEFDEKQLNPAEDRVAELVQAGRLDEARRAFVQQYAPLRARYDQLSQALSGQAQRLSDAKIGETEDSMRASAYHIIACLAGGILLVAAALFVLVRRVSRQISAVSERLSSAAFSVSGTSSVIAQSSGLVSEVSTTAAASVEETVASIEELSSMVKLNAENSVSASRLSSEGNDVAKQAEAELRELMRSMAEIAQSSRKVDEIIGVIDDIAFQTNLLALNAAVEAARAGEQGKGFAVVAEAVRALAQRSAAAAKDITALIRDSVGKTESGVKSADSSGEVLQKVVASISRVAELNREIASASTEQSNGITQISKAMNQLDSASQQNAGSANELAQSSSALAEQSRLLKILVSELNAVVHGRASAAQAPVGGAVTEAEAREPQDSWPEAAA